MSGDCEAIRERLSAYADGELAPAEEARVRDHLAGCAACRERLADLERMDEALASEDLSRPEHEWEHLASRVDAAVAAAAEADRRADRVHHGWPRRKRGFLRGLIPAPVAFGSASTIVAVLLVVLFIELQKGGQGDVDLALRGALRASAPAKGVNEPTGSPAKDRSATAPPEEKLRALGYLQGGSASAGASAPGERPEPMPVVAKRNAAPAVPESETPPTASPGTPSAAGLRREPGAAGSSAALRPIESSLRLDRATPPASPPPPAAELEKGKAAPPAAALASGETAAAPDSTGAGEASGTEGVLVPSDSALAAALPEHDPRTLSDFAREYAERRIAPVPPQLATRTPSRPRAQTQQTGRQDAMSQMLEQKHREQDQALGLALAREVYLFAEERRREGDREAAIGALLLLLDNEHGRIREQAWHDLIQLEGERALEGKDATEITRVAETADAFLREYPKSQFRIDVLKRRIVLWAAAVERDPDARCSAALAAEAQWEAGGARQDPAAARASDRIRAHCLK